MLALIASHQVYRLLNQIKVEALRVVLRIKIEIRIYKALLARIKQCIDVGLIPSCLLNRLKLSIKVIHPNFNIRFIRLSVRIEWRKVHRHRETTILEWCIDPIIRQKYFECQNIIDI